MESSFQREENERYGIYEVQNLEQYVATSRFKRVANYKSASAQTFGPLAHFVPRLGKTNSRDLSKSN